MNAPSSSFLAAGPRLLRRGADVRRAVCQAQAAGKSVGLVPTMGALHQGHLSLVRAAQAQCAVTVVTIFVNPKQFGANEDWDAYPRTLEDDLEALRPYGVDVVFAPSQRQMYPPGFSTYVEPPQVAAPWEGACRPGHFRGVATVVLKLFQLAPADTAFFGQKDYQQALVIRRMVEDLNLPIRIRLCPIVRESDGLAMSSRNRYLTSTQRQQALALSRSLALAARLVEQGEQNPQVVRDAMKRVFVEAGVDQVDYIALADPETLAERQEIRRPLVALVAARLGNTRLIDNRMID